MSATVQRHDDLVASIFRLEMDTGIGLSSEARDWYDAQEPRTVKGFPGHNECLACGTNFYDDSEPRSFRNPKLCTMCRQRLDA